MNDPAARLPLLATCLLALTLPAHANVVPDPSFENGTWSLGDNTMAIVDSPVHSGRKALRMNNTGNGVTNVAHNAWSRVASSIEPGQEYVFDVWVSGNNVKGIGGGGKPLAVVRWRNGSGALRTGENKVSEGYRWASYGTYGFSQSNMTMHMQAPSDATQVDFAFRTWRDNTGGYTVWDDVRFVPRTFPDRGSRLARHEAEAAAT
jgi:hypothetical protein